jgi:hypothetical protein
LQPGREGRVRNAWLALLSFVFIGTGIKMMTTEKVAAQHVEGVLIQFNLVFRQVLSKKLPH